MGIKAPYPPPPYPPKGPYNSLLQDKVFLDVCCIHQGLGKCVGGCQNYGPFLAPYYNTAPII